MLNQPSVVKAFDDKRDRFHAFDAEQRRQQQNFESRLSHFGEMDSDSILARLDEAENDWPGALPTVELDEADNLCLPFAHRWNNHQEAREWARDVLQERVTIAVDGSQIVPTTEYLPLVGATQIGWFVNEHREGGRYEKDLAFDILAPDELLDGDGNDDDSVATQIVNQVRFVGECDALCELMGEHTDMQDRRPPLAFFDGSFIISFAGRIRESRARHYIDAVQRLLDTSRRRRSPLVGYVDSSRSRDIVSLINALNALDEETKGGEVTVSDGALLHPVLDRLNWGDRTPLFICARNDGLSSTSRGQFYRDVVFCYMRLSSERTPARIEMPKWVFEKGLADEVLDVVRAECVVGAGYPYAIETADALAVISQQDRRRFYRLLQRLMEERGFDFIQTRKAQSKRSRR